MNDVDVDPLWECSECRRTVNGWVNATQCPDCGAGRFGNAE
jgi:rubrerythrin